MLSIPVLKFEKTNSYLNTQLVKQKNNEKLIAGIISHINYSLENKTEENSKDYSKILQLANDFSKNISENIKDIKKLNSKINNINKKISNIISQNDDIEKTPEYYIKQISKIKTNIKSYQETFKLLDKKLLSDNINLNNFILENGFNSIKSNKAVKNIKTNKINNLSIEEKLENIKNASCDNEILLISERLQKICIPYKLSELEEYIKNNPDTYDSLQDVVEKNFTLPFSNFNKHPSKSRFSEAFNLLRKDGNSFVKSVAYAFKLSNKRNLNPAIITCCKTKQDLDEYLKCLDSNTLDNFKKFKIIYDINPF